ncbi:MAG: FAD:protein FMN transferase, partial [Muribaculaceae bacterium]|nr:FAD:protein FMN transferase [Muribaculaceae bacterium]
PVESAGAEHQQGVVVNITDCGLATSGNYRNFHKEGKTTLGHTISPLTGRPVQTDVISATVMAPTCMEADGAATACMAAGSAMAKRLLKEMGYEGMLILSDTTVWMSDGFMK